VCRDLEHERLRRAGWAVHAGVGLFNQKGNKFMYGNATRRGKHGGLREIERKILKENTI
jgi:hypothetical protein